MVLSSDASVLQAPEAQALKDDLKSSVGTLRANICAGLRQL